MAQDLLNQEQANRLFLIFAELTMLLQRLIPALAYALASLAVAALALALGWHCAPEENRAGAAGQRAIPAAAPTAPDVR